MAHSKRHISIAKSIAKIDFPDQTTGFWNMLSEHKKAWYMKYAIAADETSRRIDDPGCHERYMKRKQKSLEETVNNEDYV